MSSINRIPIILLTIYNLKHMFDCPSKCFKLFQLPHKYKIVIAGNHELGFDSSRGRTDTVLEQARSGHRGCGHGHGEEAEGHNHDSKSLEVDLEAKLTYNVNPNDIRNVLTNCTYLEDSSVEICGLKIYGRLYTIISYVHESLIYNIEQTSLMS